MDILEFVVFMLGEEEYAIDILFAQEIMRIPLLKKLPNMPPFLEGIFNLRGKIIPVFDLKKRFNLIETERGSDSRLLILDIEGMKAGIIVDEVMEVMKIDKETIEVLDDELVGLSKTTIEAVCLIEKRIIILLNAVKLRTEIFNINIEKEYEL